MNLRWLTRREPYDYFVATMSGNKILNTYGQRVIVPFDTVLENKRGKYDNSAGNYKWSPGAGLIVMGVSFAQDGGAGYQDYTTHEIVVDGGFSGSAKQLYNNWTGDWKLMACGTLPFFDLTDGSHYYQATNAAGIIGENYIMAEGARFWGFLFKQ